MFYICCLLLNLFFTNQCLAKNSVQTLIPQLEQLIVKGMKETQAPGLAIAIVQNDKVLYARGFGLREAGRAEEITLETVFPLASVSKSLTATIIASLVGQGTIQWETKIAALDPSFRLPDPWVTTHLTIKDLLSHRSGLPDHAGDLLEDLGFDRFEILSRLQYLKKTGAFRSDYAYTNFGFSQAAFALENFLDQSWEAVAQERLFTPLNMHSSSYSYQDYLNRPNKAVLHRLINGKPQVSARDPDAQAPAGGASASIQDLAQWMILCLSQGTYQGKQLVDRDALLQTQFPVVVSGSNLSKDETNFYGLGMGISYDDQGHKLLKHSGAFALGARSQVVLVPDLNLGIAVLVNASSNALPESLTQSFLDLFLKGALQEDWFSAYHKLWMAEVEPPPIVITPAVKTLPSLPLMHYTGSYSNLFFGEIKVLEKEGVLELWIGPKPERFLLQHHDRDVFVLHTRGENGSGETQVIFTFDKDRKVREVVIDAFNAHGNGRFTPKEKTHRD